MTYAINQGGAVHQHYSIDLSDRATLDALVPSQAGVCLIRNSLGATTGRFLNIKRV